MLIGIGDSLTAGTVGYSYITFLPQGVEAVNKGVNGDTTHWAFVRLKHFLENRETSPGDVCVIFIGTNDVLIPYMAELSFFWRLHSQPRKVLKKCITDDGLFRAEYEKYFFLLAEHGVKAVAVGLPLIQLENYPTDAMLRRSAIIKELAEKHGAPYIDMYGMQQAVPRSAGAVYTWRHRELTRLMDAFFMITMPYNKDSFAHRRHLELTVDGVHFSSLSARLLSGAVMAELSK